MNTPHTLLLLETDHRRVGTYLADLVATHGNVLLLDDDVAAAALAMPLKRYRAGLLALCELGGLSHEILRVGRPSGAPCRTRTIIVRPAAAVWQWVAAANLCDEIAADLATAAPGAQTVQLRKALTDAVRAGSYAQVVALSDALNAEPADEDEDAERYTDEDAIADGAPVAAFLSDDDAERFTAEDAAALGGQA